MIRFCATHGRLAQLVERLPYKQDVAGSSPPPPIWFTAIIVSVTIYFDTQGILKPTGNR